MNDATFNTLYCFQAQYSSEKYIILAFKMFSLVLLSLHKYFLAIISLTCPILRGKRIIFAAAASWPYQCNDNQK